MKGNLTVKVVREFLWWAVTFLIVVVILQPIHQLIHFKFTYSNAFLIIVAITYFRFIVFFKDILLFRNKWIRLIIFIFNIYLFIFIFSKVQDFNVLFETYKINEFANHLKDEIDIYQEGKLLRYIYHEIILSLTASMLMVIGLNFRLLTSYFKRNRGRLEPTN